MKFRTIDLVPLVLAFCMLVIFVPAHSQTPDAFKYQAIARDSDGNPIADQSVGFLIRIMQGSESGTEVYAETHSTTTNGYGLANLELGRGDSLSATYFDSIMWEDGPYFIEISLDASGGTSYQLLGTSPLLAVPYAMHARQASRAAFADSVAGLPPVYHVGDTVHGGVVYYVDQTGRHGLVAALSAQSQGIIWGDAGRGILGIKGVFGGSLVIGAGQMNTAVIAAAHPNLTTAAHVCLQYTGGGYGDWYLPSTTEAKLLAGFLYQNNALPDINTFFWTSDENGSGDNLAQHVSPFSTSFRIQKNTLLWAWAIRRF